MGGVKRFFRNDAFQFEVECALGEVYHRGGDVGEILATVAGIKDGDHESWYRAWLATAERIHGIADRCAAAGHTVSARDAYLRACSYYFKATVSLDGTADPGRLVPTWQRHRACFDAYAALRHPSFENVAIPYEGTRLVGYVFKADPSDRPRPMLIVNNGSDGPLSGLWLAAGVAALERGYNAMTFDGPGQGEALWIQHLPFRHDWEAVITPVVDYLLTRKDVDPERIALLGMSQGGYWVPRAVAFEHRIAAAIADPGVFDVSTAWLENLPKSWRRLLEEGKREKFDRDIRIAMHFVPRAVRQTMALRMKPYGTTSPYEAFQAVRKYTLEGVAERIRCPMLILEPEEEQFWPGQAQRLYDALRGPRTLVRFTAAEGAQHHCEPMARSLCDQRIFDWLDETLRLPPAVGGRVRAERAAAP